MIEIREVKTRRELRTFIDYPVKLYRDNPYFTPYIYEDEVSNLTPTKNPASRYCDFKLFLAYKDGKVAGRICAIINRYANTKYQQKRIRFNRIDMIDDIEVTKALIGAVEAFGKENGLEEINGPLGYSDQDKEGLLTHGFDQHNMFATFYTHPYYVDHLVKLGFVEDAVWKEYRIYMPAKVDEKLKKIADFTAKKYNLHMAKIKSKRHKDIYPYVRQVIDLTNRAYKDLYGYVPVEEDLMDHLVKQYIPMINLDYLIVVCDVNEKVVGFGLSIPSPVFALKKTKGHLFPFGFIRFFRALKKTKILDMLLIAVEPELKNAGIVTMIFAEAINNAVKNGIVYAETGPELEDNASVQALWKIFRTDQHKRRACFLKKIDA